MFDDNLMMSRHVLRLFSKFCVRKCESKSPMLVLDGAQLLRGRDTSEVGETSPGQLQPSVVRDMQPLTFFLKLRTMWKWIKWDLIIVWVGFSLLNALVDILLLALNQDLESYSNSSKCCFRGPNSAAWDVGSECWRWSDSTWILFIGDVSKPFET